LESGLRRELAPKYAPAEPKGKGIQMKKQSSTVRISLVTSLYQSENYLEEFYRRSVDAITTITTDYQIILVNDGSPDNSLAIAKKLADRDEKIVVIDLARNFGQHKALLTGLRAASGDYVFVCDSDLEEQPEWIPLFFQTVSIRGCDVAFGVQTGIKGSRFYRLASGIFYRAMRLLSGANFPEKSVTSRIMSRRYVDSILEFGEREIFLAGIWHMAGFNQVAIPVVKSDTSPTNYSLGHLVALFLNAITAFSNRPLYIISVAGLSLCVLAFFIICYLAYLKLVLGIQSNGWASVMSTIILIGGIIIFFNGIIAIYVAKIFIEVKQRPLTGIREVYVGTGVSPPNATVLSERIYHNEKR
jgi:putative glycosyltransferase